MTTDEPLANVPEEIDETATAAPSSGLQFVEPASQPYDPQQNLDAVRARLAYYLVGLFALTVVGTLALVFVASANKVDLGDIRLIIGVVITPLVTLVGAVTGFYFGAHMAGTRGGRAPRQRRR